MIRGDCSEVLQYLKAGGLKLSRRGGSSMEVVLRLPVQSRRPTLQGSLKRSFAGRGCRQDWLFLQQKLKLSRSAACIGPCYRKKKKVADKPRSHEWELIDKLEDGAKGASMGSGWQLTGRDEPIKALKRTSVSQRIVSQPRGAGALPSRRCTDATTVGTTAYVFNGSNIGGAGDAETDWRIQRQKRCSLQPSCGVSA